MRYFAMLPNIYYENALIKNIMIRLDFNKVFKSVGVAYDPYIIREGETPETVAFLQYGDANRHWIIFLANSMIDPLWEWPLTQDEMLKYLNDKYGSTGTIADHYAVHHYETNTGSPLGEGVIVHSSYSAGWRDAVTNYDYEDRLNEAKRIIRLVNPLFVPLIEKQYKEIINKIGRNT